MQPRAHRRTLLTCAVAACALALAACAPPETADADLDARVAEQQALIAEQEQVIAELEERLVEAEEGVPAEQVTPVPDPQPDTASPRSEEGLTEQLHARGDWGMPDGNAGATDWQADAFEIPEELTADGEQTFTTPGELMLALVEAWGLGSELGGDTWEVTIRVLAEGPEGAAQTEADTAMAAVLLWGFLDDAVAGEDRLLELRQDDDGWYVASGQARFHCSRGVAEDLCV